MKNIGFILTVFNGNGWTIPIRDLLSKTKFKSVIVDLSDLGIFYLSDVFTLKNKDILTLKLNHLDLNPLEREELEKLLSEFLDDLIKYEDLKNKLVKYSIILVICLFFGYGIFNIILDNHKLKESELKSLKNSIERKNSEIRTIENDLIKISEELENCK